MSQADPVRVAKDKKQLGRGLSALLGEVRAPAAAAPGEAPRGIRNVSVGQIVAGQYQPRRRFDEDDLAELVASVKAQGVLQPILVRKHPREESKFELIAGERRWRAAQAAQLHEIPALVRDFSDREALEAALVENLQRQDLNAIEEAAAYRRLMDEFDYTQEQVAAGLGKSRPYVANIVRLLDLPDDVQALLRSQALTPGHARLLIGLDKPLEVARRFIDHAMTVREAEAYVQALKARGTAKKPAAPRESGSADTRALERSLAATLGLKVAIQSKGKAGSVTIHYQSLDQLDDLLTKLTGEPKL